MIFFINLQKENKINSEFEEKENDETGSHPSVVVVTCRKKDCYAQKCDTADAAQCPLKDVKDSNGCGERAGVMTHKVPPKLSGVLLDNIDAKGDKKDQYLAKDEAVIPVDMSTFKSNEQKTAYVQKDHITQAIVDNMPPNSVYDLNKKAAEEGMFNNISNKDKIDQDNEF